MRDMTDASSPIHILLVEDSADDAALTLRALKRAKLQNHVWTVSDGLDALAFLRGDPPHQGAPRPDLVLLDLNLPKLDGRDVLLRIREAAGLAGLLFPGDRKRIAAAPAAQLALLAAERHAGPARWTNRVGRAPVNRQVHRVVGTRDDGPPPRSYGDHLD